MRYTRLIITFVVLNVIAPTHADSFVFTNASIVTMTGEDALETGELVVVDGVIAEIGKNLARPAGATVIDVGGGFLMPGLAEMHAHVPSPSQGSVYRDDVLFLWVAQGVTTARGMLGHPDHLALRDDLLAHRTLGPRLITSGPSFNGRSVTSSDQAAAMVREQNAAGYDFLKIHPGMSLAEFDRMADEAQRLGIAFAGHVPADVGLLHALERRQLTIDHLDGYMQALVPDLNPEDPGLRSFFGAALVDRGDPARIGSLVTATREAGVWVVPTETLFENFADADRVSELLERPEIAYLPSSVRENYVRALEGAASSAPVTRRYVQLRKRMLRALHEGGAGILLGSDSPQIFNVPGFSIHRELKSMVAAGLSPYEALRTGTVNPAAFFTMEEVFGQLVPGMAADIVWVAANPLADIRNTADVQGVMVRGKWLGPRERRSGLLEIARRYRAEQ